MLGTQVLAGSLSLENGALSMPVAFRHCMPALHPLPAPWVTGVVIVHCTGAGAVSGMLPRCHLGRAS